MADAEDLNHHRHLRAAKEAEAIFREDFARYPGECFAMRASQPFQFPGWGPMDHLKYPFTIARMSRCRTQFSMHPMTAEQFPPDGEQLFYLLWKEFIDPNVPGTMLDYKKTRRPEGLPSPEED